MNLKLLVWVEWEIELNTWIEYSATECWNTTLNHQAAVWSSMSPWVRLLITNTTCMKIFYNWRHFTVKQHNWLTFADRWKFIIEASWQACAWCGSHKKVAFITCIINHCTNVKILGHHCWIWWLFRFSTCLWFWN